MTRKPSASANAIARSLFIHIQRKGGSLTLGPDTLKQLHQRGLTRAEVRRATDDLVADRALEITHDSCGQIVLVARKPEIPTPRTVMPDARTPSNTVEVKSPAARR